MKKHWRWILLLLPVLFLGGFLRWKTRQPEYVLRQFSERQGGRLNNINGAAWHLKALENWKKTRQLPTKTSVVSFGNGKPFFFVFSWYRDHENIVEVMVYREGVIICGWASKSQTNESTFMPEFLKHEMNELKQQLSKYPGCVAPAPTMENALFVSYYDGETWQARVYDRRYLPKPVRDTLKLFKGEAKDFLEREKPDQTQ